jgi:serine protease Do
MKLAKVVGCLFPLIVLSLQLCGQSASSSSSTAQSSILQQYDQALDDIAERAMRSVVEIDVTGYGAPESSSGSDSQTLQRQRALGSGVIVDPSGYIVTNNHVVSGALRITVVLSPATVELAAGRTHLARERRVYPATLIGTNRRADLAVIKIDEKNLPIIPLPLGFNVRLGQTVIAIGSPQGLDHTVTKGIVSAVGRQPDPEKSMVYVQTDAPINPGNSGGPLIDRNGNLVGINTFIYTSGGGSEGLGFAIPEPIVRFVYNELKAHGTVQAITIGAHAQAITSALADAFKLPQESGVILSDVEPGSPAEHAGLQAKDIVVSVDGFLIDSLPKYTAFLYLHPRGNPLAMQVLRGDKTISASMMPVDAPPTLDNLSDLINPKTDLIGPLGVFTVDLKGELAESYPSRSKSGVVVAGLLNGEPATAADLRVGDIVYAVDGRQISSTEQLRQQLATFKPGQSVVFEVERQSVVQYVAFEME